jgi:transketolase
VHTSTVLYPSDAVSAAKLVGEMADLRGISYMRTTRGAYPVIYDNDERFPVGGAKVVRQTDNDIATLIGAGVTLHSCIAAADRLAKSGVHVRVIDLYSVKPLDVATLRQAAAATGGKLIVVEDHYPQGGLGAAVMEALALDEPAPRIAHLAVRDLPGSGSPEELMAAAGIDAAAIVLAVKQLTGVIAEVA